MSTAGGEKSWPRNTLTIVALFCLAAAFVYWPALRGGWLWDDELDVTGNLQLRNLSGLRNIWLHPSGLYDYYPVKYTVQWIQWHLWQTDTLGYHVTNIVLHVVAAVLVWRTLQRLGVGDAWLGAGLFLVHPLAVESVAWITELKNTLSLPLLLGAFLRYLDFGDNGRRRSYFAAVAFFLAALLCKSSVVMFPFLLLVHAWWKRQRIGFPDVRAAAPFFLLSLAFGCLTIWFQQHRALGAVAEHFDPIGGIGARIACAGSALAFYFWKALVPTGLMTIYPQWTVNPPTLHLFLPWLALAAVAIWAWRQRATWGRHVLFGAGWFTLHLIPVLGFVPISSQRFTWVMDHLAYVPLLGLVALIAAGAGTLRRKLSPTGSRAVAGLGLVVCATFALLARQHAAAHRDEETLWLHTVRQNPGAWMALYNLGNIAAQNGKPADAIDWYRQALKARADYPEAWNNLGNEWRNLGNTAEAIVAYNEAIRLKPDHFAAHNNLGAALAVAGRPDDAIARCQEALRINPRFAPAERNWGNILARSGRNEEAIVHLKKALQLQPDFAEAANDLGVTLANAGRREEAVASYQRALTSKTNYVEAETNLGSALRELGRRTEAIAHLKRAISHQPNYAEAHYNLGCVLLEEGAIDQSRGEFTETLRLNPNHAEAHFNLGNLLAGADETTAALDHFSEATRLKPRFAEAYHNAGIVLARAGRTSEAVTQYRSALQQKPDYVEAYINLAVAYQTLGNMNEAITAYEAARRLKPDLPPISR